MTVGNIKKKAIQARVKRGTRKPRNGLLQVSLIQLVDIGHPRYHQAPTRTNHVQRTFCCRYDKDLIEQKSKLELKLRIIGMD